MTDIERELLLMALLMPLYSDVCVSEWVGGQTRLLEDASLTTNPHPTFQLATEASSAPNATTCLLYSFNKLPQPNALA